MKVLLIYPTALKELIGWGDVGAVAEPLALEYLAAGAREGGHDVRLLDLRLHPDDLDLQIDEYQPDLVGVTGYSMHVLRALKICARVKERRPACRTIVGGHHATLMPEDFLEPQVDFVCSGEGVRPFQALLRHLEGGGDVPAIPGIWARADGAWRFGGEQGPLTIDDLPFPDRTLLPEDRPHYFIDWMKPIALLRTTVGCPFRCSFCSLWKIMDGRYYVRETRRVVDELEQIPEECVFMVDDEAFIDGRRMHELALAIRDAGVKKRFFAYCRIDSLLRQPELMTLWHEVGMERLFIGIEGISSREMQDYNKRLKLSQVEEGLQLAERIGIRVFAQFIVNPEYTRDDFKRLVRFIEHNRIEYPSFTILTPIPGTEAMNGFDHILEKQPNGRPNWDLFDLQHVVVRTRLPREVFEGEYRDLQKVFGGRYTEHTDLSQLATASRGLQVC